jgi:D-cysteine desulfhydrase
MHTKFHLGFFPTPLEKLENLSKRYSNYNIYIKRDDQTGLALGGNKTRKLEYLIQDALYQNCNAIITAGAQQSNHCRQTAAACAKANLKCFLMLGGEEPAVYQGNLLLSKLLGANIIFTGNNRKGEEIHTLLEKLKNDGLNPYVIPYGGSNFIGSLGYVHFMKELKQQITDYDLCFDAIVFASSSGGTQAGLILGKYLYNLKSNLYAIAIDKEELNGKNLNQIVEEIVKEGVLKLQIQQKINSNEYNLIESYNKSGYGVITENEIHAIKTLALSDGIILDPVYTGRAFYGLLDLLEKQIFRPNANILFLHTGGFPANFYFQQFLQ